MCVALRWLLITLLVVAAVGCNDHRKDVIPKKIDVTIAFNRDFNTSAVASN